MLRRSPRRDACRSPAGFGTAERVSAPDLQVVFRRAEAAYTAGAYTQARADLTRLLRIAGEQPPILHLLALVERRLGDDAAAAQAFERALYFAPVDPQINNNYAALLDALGRADDALIHFSRALATMPNFAGARLNRALLLQRLGRFGEALADLDAVAVPTARLYTARAAILRDLGRLDQAAAAYDAALTLEPARPIAMAGRARVALERGEADAVRRHEQALVQRPDDRQLRLGLALALEADGEESAVKVMEALLHQHPRWPEAHEQLSRMRSEAGDHADPTRSYSEILRKAPGDVELSRSHWNTLIRAERFDDALAAIAAARSHVTEDRAMLAMEALAASEAGRRGYADAIFARLGSAPDIDLGRARHLLRVDDPAAACALLEALAKRAPDDIVVWAHLALAWRLLEDDRWRWLCDQPGFVVAVDLDFSAFELEELAGLLRGLHRTRAHPIGQSLRGGTQTRGRLLIRREPALARLRERLETAVGDYVRALPPADSRHPLLRHRSRSFRLTGSWSVRLSSSGFHVNHIHPEGVFSSAFYVGLPPSIGRTGTRDGWLDLGAPPVGLGLGLAPLLSVEPRPGRLALFPSYLFHGTRPFASGERLTVAFDVQAA